MSNGARTDLQTQAQQLLDGPLKHIRVAALAAALLPLASLHATPASAQTLCGSAGVCGTVFNDTNNNGIQDTGENGIEGAKVTICMLCDGTDDVQVETAPDGTFSVDEGGGLFTVAVLIPTGTQPSPVTPGGSQGVPNGSGYSVVTNVQAYTTSTDFGFHTIAVTAPGTGTPGFWKNHPDAWPVSSITVGGTTYTETQAIGWLNKVGKDKSTTMFASLVSAMLSIIEGNDGSCVSDTVAQANAWMATYPVGSNVAGGSAAWAAGAPLQGTLDAYDNGQLCAPHRK